MARKKKNSSTTQEENLTLTETSAETAATEASSEEAAADTTAEWNLSADEETEVEEAEVDETLENPDFATGDIEQEASLFLKEEADSESFLPEVDEESFAAESSEADLAADVSLEGTELDAFESADIEEVYFVEDERLESIIESILFASDRPVSLASLKLVFKGTNVRTDKIKRALDQLAVEYAGGRRGVTLEEVPGGFQLRTKIDNMEFLRRTLKARQFKLSGPALEVLSILAYKQPVVKAEIDEIRGVESGHLLRALMEKGLANFEGKSELPGRPMQYATTKKFLEIFGLRNLKELPTLSQIDELLPEGINEETAVEKPTLSSITDALSESIGNSYSQGEDELMKIQEQLEEIATSSQFFEEEKRRQAEKRDQEKAQNIREALAMSEPVSTRDTNWLKRYDEALAAGTTLQAQEAANKAASLAALNHKENTDAPNSSASDESENADLAQAIAAFDAETEDEENKEATSHEVLADGNDVDTDVEFETEIEAGSEAEADFSADNDEDHEEDDEDELPFLAEADDIDEEGGAHA